MSPRNRLRVTWAGFGAFAVVAFTSLTFCSLRARQLEMTGGLMLDSAMSLPVVNGITGKQCFEFRGCGTAASFTACYKCCLGCPSSIQNACIDECLKLWDDPDKRSTLARASTDIDAGRNVPESVALLDSVAESSDKRMRRCAMLMKREKPEALFH